MPETHQGLTQGQPHGRIHGRIRRRFLDLFFDRLSAGRENRHRGRFGNIRRLACVLFGALLCAILGSTGALAADFDAVVEWTGPYLRAIDSPQTQETDSPVIDVPFSAPYSVATRAHDDGRDVVYVVDTGNRRIQLFEANATYEYLSHADLTYRPGGATAASEWDDDQIHPPAWASTASRWIAPRSETVRIGGNLWSWVPDLTGFTADDLVYTIDYTATSSAPTIEFPTGSLSASSVFIVQFLASDNQTGAADAYGIGDIDYGIGSGGSPVLTEIGEASGGPASFQTLRSAAVIENEITDTTDDVFVLDSADDSGGFDETLLLYSVAVDGTVAFEEAYDDSLSGPFSVAVARSGASVPATVTISSDFGLFVQGTAAIFDDSQVTGHSYDVVHSGGDVTITDLTTGRIMLDDVQSNRVEDPYYGIPGLELPSRGGLLANTVVSTTAARPARYLFVADTGANEIRVIPAAAGASFNGDWLPSDKHSVVTDPGNNYGEFPDIDYAETTPSSVPADWSFRAAANPFREGVLETITFDTDGPWTRVDDLGTAGPTDKVYEVDWDLGRLSFGNDTNGAIPPANEEIYYAYFVTLETTRFGTSGTGSGEFDAPEGIAARWNSTLGGFDVYVADTGNDRIQKLVFYPKNVPLGLAARLEYVTAWTVASGADALDAPSDVCVREDGESTVWVGVADTGNDRIVLYRDTAAAEGTGSSIAADFETEFGTSGTGVGQFQLPTGVEFLPNGTGIDVYAADAARGVVTKHEQAPDPTLDVVWPEASCYGPGGSITFDFIVTNPPSGGFVDWYYDTTPVFGGSAQLVVPASSVGTTETTITWVFADTPGGPPADGTYYVFARVKNDSGNVLVMESTGTSETVCIDETIVPTVALRDLLDGDTTLSFQSSGTRIMSLALAYPDSARFVSYDASFDPTLIEVVGITRGTAWDGIGATSYFFDYSIDEVLGTFNVTSSALGTPIGLTGVGPYPVGYVEIRTRPDVLDLQTRFVDSSIDLQVTGSTIENTDGGTPPDLRIEAMDLRMAYLGDIATTGEGADGSVPSLSPNPDGFINFADVIAFSLGWSGSGFTRDPIADLGPAEGTPPNLISSPDGIWDIEDVVVLTQMYSWAGAMGFGTVIPSEPDDDIGGRSALAMEEVADEAEFVLRGPMDEQVAGQIRTLQIEIHEARDLLGASVVLEFDPETIEIIDVDAGDFFDSAREGSLFLHRGGTGWLDLAATRLGGSDSENNPTSGVVANIVVRALRDGVSGFRTTHDLRSSRNTVLSRGLKTWGAPVQLPEVRLQLSVTPNPSNGPTEFRFGLPEAAPVTLMLYDATGRRIRSLLDQTMSAGWHSIFFDGRNEKRDPLRPGIYFSRLDASGQQLRRKLIIY